MITNFGHIVADSLDLLLINSLWEVKEFGKIRNTRGFTCKEYPEPVVMKLTNPSDRYVTIPERKWNKVLPFAEFLWLMLGLNDLDSLPGTYVKNLYNFSDDGKSWRAGYGPRLRHRIGFNSDRVISHPKEKDIFSGMVGNTDQLRFVIESLQRDLNTRQAVIDIGDPVVDNFDNNKRLKVTKDQPCTRILNFQVRDMKLDLTVYMRSNDIIWGLSSVNVFNFTTLQEIVAAIIDIPVGNYYHIANNLHYYDDKEGIVDSILNSNYSFIYKPKEPFYYNFGINFTLEELDSENMKLWEAERNLVKGNLDFVEFKYKFHQDFFNVFYNYHNHIRNVTTTKVVFTNPYLNNLFFKK